MYYNLYFIVLIISFLSSLICFRLDYPFHLKFFSIFLGLTLLTESCAVFWLPFFHLNTNYPIYNFYFLFAYLSYSYYFSLIITSKISKTFIRYFAIIYPLFWLTTTIFIFGLTKWNSYSSMLGDCFLVIISIVNIYELFISEEVIDFKRSPEFWISVGTFIYSCCEIPITGILNYLGNNYASIVYQIENILQVLNIIMYLIFIYAFICRKLTNTTKLQ